MKTTIMIAAGALVALTMQGAVAAERHHATRHVAAHQTRANPADAYARWQPAQPEVNSEIPSYYSGGYSAPAGR